MFPITFIADLSKYDISPVLASPAVAMEKRPVRDAIQNCSKFRMFSCCSCEQNKTPWLPKCLFQIE